MSKTRDISCDEALRFVFEFIDHELDHRRHEEMEHHLAKCRSCFSRVEFERRLKARLREAGSHRAPASLRARVGKLLHKY
jgi:anti-sigma factor (TIGR02949 family)